jgi:hypothetical protein
VRIVIDRADGGYHWRLVRRTSTGADVLARGVGGCPDETACHQAVATLAGVPGEAGLVIQQPDGHWHWRVSGPDGQPLAESPGVYRDATRCGRALADLRVALDSLPALANLEHAAGEG